MLLVCSLFVAQEKNLPRPSRGAPCSTVKDRDSPNIGDRRLGVDALCDNDIGRGDRKAVDHLSPAIGSLPYPSRYLYLLRREWKDTATEVYLVSYKST